MKTTYRKFAIGAAEIIGDHKLDTRMYTLSAGLSAMGIIVGVAMTLLNVL